MQGSTKMYAEYGTKSLVCSVGWNHAKFQHLYYAPVPPLRGPQTFYMSLRGLKENIHKYIVKKPFLFQFVPGPTMY